jgi:hypothetical protein
MKKLILLFVVAISLAFQVDCNIRRSDVRLLFDEDAKKIYWSPKKTTIKSFSSLVQNFPTNNKKFDFDKRYNNEFNFYFVNCLIKGFEKENGYYKLYLQDTKDTNFVITGFIPNETECYLVKKSKYKNVFKALINDIESYISSDGTFDGGLFQITGVCFFDLQSAKYVPALCPIMDIYRVSKR